MVQVHVPATVWGFESLRWHQRISFQFIFLICRKSYLVGILSLLSRQELVRIDCISSAEVNSCHAKTASIYLPGKLRSRFRNSWNVGAVRGTETSDHDGRFAAERIASAGGNAGGGDQRRAVHL